jgi:hypothetical protein
VEAVAQARCVRRPRPAPRLLLRRHSLGQPLLQGDGQPHGARGPRKGQPRIGAVRTRALGHGARHAPGRFGDLHADLGQPLQLRHLPLGQRARGRVVIGEGRGGGERSGG